MRNWPTRSPWSLLLVALLSWIAVPHAVAGVEPIRWRSGDTAHVPQTGSAKRDAMAQAATTAGQQHLVVQFDSAISTDGRHSLAASGLLLLSYLGSNAYFATVDPARIEFDQVAALPSLTQVRPIDRRWKLHDAFATGPVPTWVVLDEGADDPRVVAYLIFHRDVALVPDGITVARRHGAVVRSMLTTIGGLVVELRRSSILPLADEDAVQWIEPPLPPLQHVNDVTRLITEADIVQAAPYDLDGTDVTVLVYDAGTALETHADFGLRLTARDNEGLSGHATHVACTVGGDGTASDGLYRGMAPNVTIESYGSLCCPPGFLYTDPLDIEEDYGEAINVYGADLSNNSIGTNVCRNGLDCEWTGDYGVTAQVIDSIVRGSLGRPFRIIWANGNERSCSRCRDEGVHTPDGYHSTAPPGCAKNHITVGALTDSDTVSSFTSWGPTDDGRIKPDVSAPGVGVVSCSTSGGYASLSGTSMAAPAVTGISALLLQDYRVQFPLLDDPRNSTLKVLLAHTAADIGNAGPDYQSGYGSVRIQQAIDFMRSDGGLNFLEDQVSTGSAKTWAVRVNVDDTELKLTLAWDDFPGTPNVDPALVNDLDLRVIDPQGAQHFPWTLDPVNPAAPAVQTQADHLNNIEQVWVASPFPGLWIVEVYGFNVPEGPQPFSLAASPRLVFDCNNNDVPDDEEILDNPGLDCSGNGILDECEPDCDQDGTVDSCEIFLGSSTDCDFSGVPDDCQAFSDCNGNGTFDPCDITINGLPDCNRNWVPDECLDIEDDCNGNQVPDECDLESGTSDDCDRNDIPDDCELVDCNDNGTLDACDILAGTSVDCNVNDIPDECEPVRTIVVDDDAALDPLPGDPTESDPEEDGSDSHPFDAIQEAIDDAACGDIILIRDGVYRGQGNKELDTVGKAIRLSSESGPANCIIDCEGDGRGFHFHSDEGPATHLEGVTIQNASANDGSGILCEGSSPTITNCVFKDGWAQQGGAGIRCHFGSDPTIRQCVFADNMAGSGSGLHCAGASHPLVEDSVFVGNVATGGGSAILANGCTPDIVNCQFLGNQGGPGGAIYFSTNIRPTITNSLFSANQSVGFGGAIFATLSASPTIANSTFWGNNAQSGGALHCTSGCNATIHNSILWGDGAAEGPEIASVGASSTVTVRSCDVAGGASAVHIEDSGELSWNGSNIEVAPQFSNAAGADAVPGTEDDNLRLSIGSPCVNAGNNNLVPEGVTTDLDGNERIVDGTVDLGAYERADFCGDGDCGADEDICLCPTDCGGLPSEGTGSICADGIDNDCDGLADCADPDCAAGPVCVCQAALTPITDGLGPKNRYVSIQDGNSGWLAALRVTLDSLPAPFDGANGTIMWVGPPQVICENSGQSIPPPGGCGPAPGLTSPTTTVATLQCEPHYDDWSDFGWVHIYHDYVVPAGVYQLQVIGLPCDISAESAYSKALQVETSSWGDTVRNCMTTPCGPPDGSVDVITDIVSILSKFSNLEGAPIKARVDLEPGSVDFLVQITDAVTALSAFEGKPYPFEPVQTPLPCSGGR